MDNLNGVGDLGDRAKFETYLTVKLGNIACGSVIQHTGSLIQHFIFLEIKFLRPK